MKIQHIYKSFEAIDITHALFIEVLYSCCKTVFKNGKIGYVFTKLKNSDEWSLVKLIFLYHEYGLKQNSTQTHTHTKK